MDSQIVTVFCLRDDLLKAFYHHEDRQYQLSDAEELTVAIVAALHLGGNQAKASRFLYEVGYMFRMLSRSRFNDRLHRLADLFWVLFHTWV